MTLFAACALALVSGCAGTGRIKSMSSGEPSVGEEASRHMGARQDFPESMRFSYLMAWNGVPIGRIVATSGRTRTYRGREVYVVSVMTESNEFLSKIYRVEDVYTSYIDTETMTSMRFEADRREGRYRKHLVVEYDLDSGEAIYANLTDGSVKRCPVEREINDPVSSMCRFMTMPVKVGDVLHMVINLNEKNYDLYGRITSLDLVRLRGMGEFPAFKLEPSAVLRGEKVEKGHGWMYFEASRRRYPLYGRVWIPFGRVTATLNSIEKM